MCDLTCSPVQHIREEQDGPLARWEELESGEEGQRDALVSGIAGFRFLRRLSQPGVRERLTPERFGTPGRNRTLRVTRRRGWGPASPPLTFPAGIQAGFVRQPR